MSDLQGFGRVCIVGAGPGPVDLMTLRALDRLQSADVVVQHRLIGVDVLERIPEDAQRVYAGKALGNHAAAAGIPLARPAQTRVFYMGIQRLSPRANGAGVSARSYVGYRARLWAAAEPAHHWRDGAAQSVLPGGLSTDKQP